MPCVELVASGFAVVGLGTCFASDTKHLVLYIETVHKTTHYPSDAWIDVPS